MKVDYQGFSQLDILNKTKSDSPAAGNQYGARHGVTSLMSSRVIAVFSGRSSSDSCSPYVLLLFHVVFTAVNSLHLTGIMAALF